MPITESDLSGVHDGDVVSPSGEKIGSVGQIYLDDQSGEPTFVTANTGLFGMSQSFVPLRGARVENGNVVVDFDKTTVKDAPRIDDDGSLTPAEEDQLYAYYGMSSATLDTGDYATTDQSPEPGYARSAADDRPDLVPGDSGPGNRSADRGAGDARLGDRTDSVRTDAGDRPDLVPGDSSPGNRTDEVRHDQGLGDRPGDAGAGIDPRKGTEFDGPAVDNKTTPDAPPADRGPDASDRDGGGDTSSSPTEEPPADRGGRLRKWVMTEYEPVKSEEVYVEGQGQPGEPPTR